MNNLIKFVDAFGKNNLYHSDLKLANITVQLDNNKNGIIKVIDLGEASNDYKKITGYTPSYMPAYENILKKKINTKV